MGGLLDLAVGARCCVCGAPGEVLCPRCSRNAPPGGEEDLRRTGRTLCAWRYVGAPRALLLGLKLRGRRDFSRPLGRGVYGAVLRHGISGDALTWVPARRDDVRRRGFDHAEVLALEVGALTGLSVVPLLRRAGASRDQSQLTRPQRLLNVTEAFVGLPCGGRIVLVDDLITTGATAGTCAAALRAAGAEAVEVLAACRA